MSERKVFRVHTHEAVYVGPQDPYSTLPPNEEIMGIGRGGEWSLYEDKNGDVIVTHRNPHVASFEIDPATKAPRAPHGYEYTTRIPSGNIKGVQYEFKPLPAPVAKVKGAA